MAGALAPPCCACSPLVTAIPVSVSGSCPPLPFPCPFPPSTPQQSRVIFAVRREQQSASALTAFASLLHDDEVQPPQTRPHMLWVGAAALPHLARLQSENMRDLWRHPALPTLQGVYPCHPCADAAAAPQQQQHYQQPTLPSAGCWLKMPPTYGSLQARLTSQGPPPPSILRQLLTQMASLLAHCHRHGVVLGDLKLSHWHFKDRARLQLVYVNVAALRPWSEAGGAAGKPEADVATRTAAAVHPTSAPSGLAQPSEPGLPAAISSTPALDVWAFGVAAFLLAFDIYPFDDAE